MPKPTIIDNPRKVAIYLPEKTWEKGKALAADSGTSLSHLVTQLIDTQAESLCKIRIHADFPANEFEEIKSEADHRGMSVEDLIRTATYHMLDGK